MTTPTFHTLVRHQIPCGDDGLFAVRTCSLSPHSPDATRNAMSTHLGPGKIDVLSEHRPAVWLTRSPERAALCIVDDHLPAWANNGAANLMRPGTSSVIVTEFAWYNHDFIPRRSIFREPFLAAGILGTLMIIVIAGLFRTPGGPWWWEEALFLAAAVFGCGWVVAAFRTTIDDRDPHPRGRRASAALFLTGVASLIAGAIIAFSDLGVRGIPETLKGTMFMYGVIATVVGFICWMYSAWSILEGKSSTDPQAVARARANALHTIGRAEVGEAVSWPEPEGRNSTGFLVTVVALVLVIAAPTLKIIAGFADSSADGADPITIGFLVVAIVGLAVYSVFHFIRSWGRYPSPQERNTFLASAYSIDNGLAVKIRNDADILAAFELLGARERTAEVQRVNKFGLG
ncbi:hypothetical protein ABLE92_12300 [Gordonia sp. VNQ95]|uniref:hypothetical protein n=1 Tax=Gordonia sp. VNQ95 TaxID=3156619 RepID=UPI0032B5BBC9